MDKDNNIKLEISAVGDKIKSETNVQAYADVKPIKDLVDTYQTFFGTNDQAPSDLPANVKSALNDAADNLSTAMYSYESGLGDVLDYLNTGKASDASDEQTQFGYASTAENVANADYRKARTDVGLK